MRTHVRSSVYRTLHFHFTLQPVSQVPAQVSEPWSPQEARIRMYAHPVFCVCPWTSPCSHHASSCPGSFFTSPGIPAARARQLGPTRLCFSWRRQPRQHIGSLDRVDDAIANRHERRGGRPRQFVVVPELVLQLLNSKPLCGGLFTGDEGTGTAWGVDPGVDLSDGPWCCATVS